jgi:hexokinase
METRKALGVKTYIVMSSLIFGTGMGSFHTSSVQIPLLMNVALKQSPKQTIVVDEGKGR